MRAKWRNVVVAESNETIVVEGNHYFPPAALKRECFLPSSHRTICPWKGVAHYLDVVAGDLINVNAAWFYPDPAQAAEHIRDRVAFWNGVTVEP
ncbi:MAG: DUF427 domain-containing protein [Dokdonella sp.]